MKFVLTINLGNEAMQTQEDIAQALHHLGQMLHTHMARFPEAGDLGVIRDANGNRVGGWHVE